jgi:hypothetical protein
LDPATKIAIPSTRYTNWDLELELESPEAEEVSNYDMLDSDQETPRKPSTTIPLVDLSPNR